MTEPEYYPIEPDIPCPRSAMNKHRAKVLALQNLLKNGDLGDSIWLPVSRNALWRIYKLAGTTKGLKVSMAEEKEGVPGYRIWKMKNP